MRLRNNDKDELYKILLQFGRDSKEQGYGELVRKSIFANDLGNVGSIRMTAFASESKEVLWNVKDGGICLFGHMANADIWLPISYDTQKHMEISACVKRNEFVPQTFFWTIKGKSKRHLMKWLKKIGNCL